MRTPEQQQQGNSKDMHNARASNIPLGSIRRDCSLPQRMAGSALICDVRNEKGKAAQAVNGQLGHGPSRRKLLPPTTQ